MDESTTIWNGIGFRDGEARTSDRLSNTEAARETACQGSLASTDVAEKLKNALRRVGLTVGSETFAEG